MKVGFVIKALDKDPGGGNSIPGPVTGLPLSTRSQSLCTSFPHVQRWILLHSPSQSPSFLLDHELCRDRTEFLGTAPLQQGGNCRGIFCCPPFTATVAAARLWPLPAITMWDKPGYREHKKGSRELAGLLSDCCAHFFHKATPKLGPMSCTEQCRVEQQLSRVRFAPKHKARQGQMFYAILISRS